MPRASATTRARAQPDAFPRLRARRGVRAPRVEAHVGVAEKPAGVQAAEIGAATVEERARIRVGLLAFTGIGLLIASELIELLERVEGEFGLVALNLVFAVPLAALVVCTAALAGDSVLALAERRIGRRPGARLVTPLLGACGGAAAIAILTAHLSRSLALDGWLGLAGSLLVMLAAVAHHHIAGARTPSER